MKYPIEKMRRCLPLLPPPGGEVVAECLDEIESLRQHVTLLRDAMKAAWRDGYAFCGAEGLSEAQKQFQEALAATKEYKMTEKIKPARVRIGACTSPLPQRFATRDPWPAVPFDHELLEPPTAYTRLWQVIVGLCIAWILGFAIWGLFK